MRPANPEAATVAAPEQSSTGGVSSREWLVLGAILLVGLALRAGYLCHLVDEPDFAFPMVDAGFHDHWARGLVTGNWHPRFGKSGLLIPQSAYFRPPGYPYFLSLTYALFGTSYLAPRLVQMGLGLVSAVLAYLFARKRCGRSVALVLAAFMSCYWIFIYFEGEFHASALLICLLWLMLCAIGKWAESRKARHALAAGLVLGVASLVRPNVLALLPLLAVWSWWLARRHGHPRSFRPAALGLLLGTAVSVAPATIRNYRVANDFVLISSNAGINLYIGNNEAATGQVLAHIPGFGDFATCYDYPALVRNLERKLGRTLMASEVSSYFATEALRFVREHPLQFVKLTLRKAGLFWGAREITHNKTVWRARETSAVLRSIPGNFSLVVALAVAGWGLMLLDRRVGRTSSQCAATSTGTAWETAVLLLGVIVVYFLSVLPFFASARYRVPVIPFLLLFAAQGTCRVGALVWTRNVRRAGCWVAVVVVLYGLHVLAGSGADRRNKGLAKWHRDRAAAYDFAGQTDKAIAECRIALEHDPRSFFTHCGLGTYLFKRGELGAAIDHFSEAAQLRPEHALPIDPDNVPVLQEMGELLIDKGRYQEAEELLQRAVEIQPESPKVLGDLAYIKQMRGQTEEAYRLYRQALALAPDNTVVRAMFGGLLVTLQRWDEAFQEYTGIIELAPDHFGARYNLGVILARMGRLDEAREHLAQALQIDPTDVRVPHAIGVLYARQGDFEKAIEYFRKALEIDPDHKSSLRDLESARRKMGEQ